MDPESGLEGVNCKHIALLPFPVAGRIVPFMSLAEKLASQGVLVSFIYFPPHRRSQVEDAYATRAGKHPLIRLVPLETPHDASPTCTGTNRLHDTISSVVSIYEDMQDGSQGAALEKLLEQLQPSCLISCEILFSLEASSAKGIPHCVLFPMAATVLSLLFHVAKDMERLGQLTLETINLDVPILGRYPAQFGEHSIVSELTSTKDKFYYECAPKLHHVAAILLNSFTEAEPAAFAALQSLEVNPNQVPIVSIGPLVPEELLAPCSMSKTPGQELLDFLNQQLPASVVYISFGSLGQPSSEQIYEIAKGLEASQKVFLWIVNSSNADDLLPEGFLKRTNQLGMVTNNWVPQLRVLSHPAIGAYMTHCGWNSTIEAMTMGIPVLTKPYMTDQFTNAWTLVDQLGMGVKLSEDGITDSKRIEEAIKLVFEDSDEGKSIRDRAKIVKAAALEAWSLAGKNLKALINNVHTYQPFSEKLC